MKGSIHQLVTPDGSDQVTPSPEASRKKVKKVQAILNFSSSLVSSQTKTCKICGMAYYEHINKEVEIHKKYHLTFINGILWPDTFKCKKVKSFAIIQKSTTKLRKSNTIQLEIVTIDKTNKRQTNKVDQLLDLVNKELNAPEDTKYWRDPLKESSKAFVVIIDDRAVGLCTTDTIEDIELQGRWMIHSSQSIVPNQVNKNIKLGISRIWIAPKWRRLGIAKVLLEIVQSQSIYGVVLNKAQIAFSQPSHSGGLLAKEFNGVIHKSGELLVPVYLEL
ncbi:N-acetyltransferase ECO1 [Scheffersomyces coipomensis]|uniref:N-acetyltransferase ECO1 n=1 Tax=Scheffersomyces coipomensis TaxID=1788519 RepID=UPI00315D95CE